MFAYFPGRALGGGTCATTSRDECHHRGSVREDSRDGSRPQNRGEVPKRRLLRSREFVLVALKSNRNLFG